ncbi:hypothetical protein BV22DRAFT_1034513 [Leucogyrophana mollusca]|uniref:Uncharacterized protein n=1 Tax=Leucogyrophana mollusca TaxID=85980 RepID=A0ACB8BHM1_9AGAM|nr:hypothetical protein BV22DRAFT_1034513 [Leucogyrophana mollusca]
MSSSTPFLDTLSAHLPSEYSSVVDSLKSIAARKAVETLLCYATGGECPSDVSTQARQDWARTQAGAMMALQSLVRQTTNKRGRDTDLEGDDADGSTKRQKTASSDDEADPPLFTLPSISTTSPVRKKVDITIHERSIRFINPASRALEAMVPLSLIKRAFLVPTRGKAKPHWTVVLLTADTPGKGKAAAQQVIFGLDATSTSKYETTVHSALSNPTSTAIAKGDDTLPSLRQLLSHLPIPVLEPSMTVFRSACATPKSGHSAAGVDAYLSAKPGTLWFFDQGLLWGESKPCEFWALEDLLAKDGVKLVSATGRTCSVIIGRKSKSEDDDEKSDNEEGGEEGIETEFSMVDGREQDPISAWVRQRKSLLGKEPSAPLDTSKVVESSSNGKQRSAPKAPISGAANGAAWDDSDSDDDDYELDSSVDLGQSSSSSSEESDDEGAEAEDGSESGGEGSDAGGGSGESGEEELNPANHPLLRPGAMPRMSKAAIHAAVDMVNEDLMGGGEESGEEEDELED